MACNGTGSVSTTEMRTCFACNGRGTLQTNRAQAVPRKQPYANASRKPTGKNDYVYALIWLVIFLCFTVYSLLRWVVLWITEWQELGQISALTLLSVSIGLAITSLVWMIHLKKSGTIFYQLTVTGFVVLTIILMVTCSEVKSTVVNKQSSYPQTESAPHEPVPDLKSDDELRQPMPNFIIPDSP